MENTTVKDRINSIMNQSDDINVIKQHLEKRLNELQKLRNLGLMSDESLDKYEYFTILQILEDIEWNVLVEEEEYMKILMN